MDILTYIPNLDLFRAECKAIAESDPLETNADGELVNKSQKFFSYDEETKEISYNVSRIPVHYNDDYTKSVCLVRLSTEAEQEAFGELTTRGRIGGANAGQYVFDSVESKAIYDTIYDQTPIEIVIEGEQNIFYTPPAMIGLFA